eukprot:Colp12_sorted_trinity150504_noHs@1858
MSSMSSNSPQEVFNGLLAEAGLTQEWSTSNVKAFAALSEGDVDEYMKKVNVPLRGKFKDFHKSLQGLCAERALFFFWSPSWATVALVFLPTPGLSSSLEHVLFIHRARSTSFLDPPFNSTTQPDIF